MKSESVTPFLKFSKINIASQLALCGVIGEFAAAFEVYSERCCEKTIDISSAGSQASAMRKALDEMVHQPHGFRVMVFDSIIQSHEKGERYAPIAYFLLQLASAVLRTMTVAPLDQKHTLREHFDLFCNFAPELAGQFVVVSSDLVTATSPLCDWNMAFKTEFPAVMLLTAMIPSYGV